MLNATVEMNAGELRTAIKRLLVTELNLKGRDPETIEDDGPLFGSGLGLDSLDALQLAMVIEERFEVKIPDGGEERRIFANVASIADFVARAKAAPNGQGSA